MKLVLTEPRKYTALYEPKRLENIREAILGNDLENKKKAKNSLMHFFNAPSDLVYLSNGKHLISSIEAFTTKGDIPDLPASLLLDVFNKIEAYDMRGEMAYKLRQFDPGQDTFSIVDITNFFTFDKLPQGAKVNLKHIKGDVAYVKAVRYADGFGWDEDMLEDRRFGEMIQIAEQFRDAYYIRRAKAHYTPLVVAAASGSSATGGTALAVQSGNNNNEKIINTISKCAAIIAAAVNGLGVHPDPSMATMMIYIDPADYDRVYTAVNTRTTSAASSIALSGRQYQVLPSFMLKDAAGTAIPANTAVMVLGGGKIQRGDKTQPKSYTDKDVLSFSQIQTVKVRFGNAVAEPKQTAMFSLPS